MLRLTLVLALAVAAFAEEVPRDAGWSQQVHYEGKPQHVGGGGGLSFDVSLGLILAVGALLLLLCFAAMSQGGGGGGGWGWGRSLQNANLAGMSEKVIGAVEKAYELYNKQA